MRRVKIEQSLSRAREKKQMESSDSTGNYDDVGALIYQESQLRKAEAAAAVAQRKKTSTT